MGAGGAVYELNASIRIGITGNGNKAKDIK